MSRLNLRCSRDLCSITPPTACRTPRDRALRTLARAAELLISPAVGPPARGTEAGTGSRRLPRDKMTFSAEEGRPA
jgi:hypothetical protein